MPTLAPGTLMSTTDLSGGAVASITSFYDPAYLQTMISRASRAVESKCGRRLAPFTVTESHMASGVDINGVGSAGDALPMSLAGSLGLDRARAYGATSGSVRDVWLEQWAPRYPELWTYSNMSVTLQRALDDVQQIASPLINLPAVDTGHLRLRLGTYCPPGTIINVTYSGGYTVAIPDDLVEACRLQLIKMLILENEPQNRPGLDTADLDGEILGYLAEYMRT